MATETKREKEPWVVRIRDNETGEVVEHHTEYGNTDGNTFIWQEGNFACDCNRGQFFCEAKGLDDMDAPCGDTHFTVLDIKRLSGEVVYSEEPQ